MRLWKDTFLLATLPSLVILLLNLWIEAPQSLQTLTAAQEHASFFSQLPEVGIFAPTSPEAVEEQIPPPPQGASYRYERTVVAKVTGYTPGEESCGKFADGRTSTGSNAWSAWGVAADPSLLPYGTLVFIPGVGYREVDDTGSAMRDAWRSRGETHIDLRFQKVKDAKFWGVRQLPVHIFIPEKP